MDETTHILLKTHIDTLGETIEKLIDHRTIIIENDEIYSTDQTTLVEPIDAQILECIEGISKALDKINQQPKRGGTLDG